MSELYTSLHQTGERVLSRIGFLRALGRTGKAKGGRQYDDEFKTPVFLSANNLKEFISTDLIENSKAIPNTRKTYRLSSLSFLLASLLRRLLFKNVS